MRTPYKRGLGIRLTDSGARLLILITFFIYIRAGRTIYEKRKQINKFHNSSSDNDPISVNGERDPMGTIKTTEVTVTTSDATPEGQGGSMQMHSMDGQAESGSYAVSIAAGLSRQKAPSNNPAAPKPRPNGEQPRRNPNPGRSRTYEANNAAWAYTKCAILFFTALLVTWIPSSANRVYSFIHAPQTLPPLEIMSAFVLPLQGFWNSIIYIVTSWAACKTFVSDMRLGRRPAARELVGGMPSRNAYDDSERQYSHFRPSRVAHKDEESESMTELALPPRSPDDRSRDDRSTNQSS